MELKWLDDYLALASCGSFTKAASVRHVTQPAFGRRIRALENWLGVQLVDRSRYPTSFTEAGIAFIDRAMQLREQILAARDEMNSLVKDREVPVIVCQHSLAVAFVPSVLSAFAPGTAPGTVKVDACNYHDALELFIGGAPDFLLCFATRETENLLNREDVVARQVGTDRLIPVSSEPPAHWLEYIEAGEPLPLLTYPSSSFFGRTLGELVYPELRERSELQVVYESALSEGLRAMALRGHGIAWLPASLVADELHREALWQLPEGFPVVELAIQLHRFKREYTEAAEALWLSLINEKHRA